MKKYILLLMLATGFSATVHAQSSFSGTTANPSGAVSNATIDTLNLTLSGNANVLIKVQAVLAKSTGTIAGTVRLYGSIYGTTSTWTPVGDTLTLSEAAVNHKVWNLTGNDLGWKYLRILQSGGTTMTGTLSAKATAIKN